MVSLQDGGANMKRYTNFHLTSPHLRRETLHAWDVDG